MSAIYLDGPSSTARVNGPKRYLLPIENVRANLDVFQQDYVQLKADFDSVPLGTPNPDEPGYYLTSETAPMDLGGGVLQWTRTYAKIPSIRDVYESYGWLVPGIGSEAVYSDVSISSASITGGSHTIITGTSSTATVGDSVSISYTFRDSTTGTEYGRRTQRACIAGTSGTTIVVNAITEPGGTIAFQTLRKIEPGRAPETLEVTSLVSVDYWLPGVSPGVVNPRDIPVIQAYEIYDGDGRKTNSHESDSTPTVAQWRTAVANRDWICVVTSIIRPWLGPIYERRTRYCIAQ